MGFFSGGKEEKKKEFPFNFLENEYVKASTNAVISFTDTWNTDQAVALGIGCTASFILGLRLGRSQPPWRRITSVNNVTSKMIGEQSPWLRGRVVTVTDGDTLRFWHTPTWLHSSTPMGKTSEVCLAIRICTIDTPETAKFGKPGQPFGDEAKEYLSGTILDKTIFIQILQKDQYGRAVASVCYRGWLGSTYMDEAMLRAGLAEVYLGSGAVYGPKGKDAYLQLQEAAKKKKKGMWSQDHRESASEFKARLKEVA
jgi:micrococcal nuclease